LKAVIHRLKPRHPARRVFQRCRWQAEGQTNGSLLFGAVAGVVGAVLGTLGGRTARAQLAAAFGKDSPAALIEDAVAILAALLIVIVIVIR
jgi:uncharacterized membrane protein